MIRDFYNAYYDAVESSHAHARFCEYAYGKNLAQHGFVTMDDLEFLIDVTQLSAPRSVLDVGCGSGGIAEYTADATDTRVVGMDFVSEAVRAAQTRTQNKRARLSFLCGDLVRLPCRARAFDCLLAMDSIYFSADYRTTLQEWARCVRMGGTMAIFFSHGANPQQPKETFDRSTLPPDKTPLGVALHGLGMKYKAWDLTAGDYALAERKIYALESLCEDFAAEGNLFLYENRIGEARGVIEAVESNMHARYLYLVANS